MLCLLLPLVMLSAGDELAIGKSAINSSATPATGKWAKAHPFNPKTYGLSRGVSPATSRDSKLVIYTQAMDAGFFRLAESVDKFLDQHPELDWSFVQILDKKGAQYGGYSVAELQTRLAEVRALATKHKLRHLSLTISAPNAANFGGQVGMTSPQSVVMVLLMANKDLAKDPTIAWVRHLETGDLNKQRVRDVVGELARQFP